MQHLVPSIATMADRAKEVARMDEMKARMEFGKLSDNEGYAVLL